MAHAYEFRGMDLNTLFSSSGFKQCEVFKNL